MKDERRERWGDFESGIEGATDRKNAIFREIGEKEIIRWKSENLKEKSFLR